MAKIVTWKSAPAENRPYQLENLNLPHPPATLNSFSHQVPGGVYTTFRTYSGKKILPLDYQIRRLEKSARLLGKDLHINDKFLRDLLRQALLQNTQGESRVRLSVDLEQDPGALYMAIEPLQVPTQTDYDHGVWVVTRLLYRLQPEAKQTAFISVQDDIQETLPEGAHEALLVDETGNILEGLSSNFFAIKDGEVRTAGDSVLQGITRSLVLEAVHRENLKIKTQSVSITELPDIQEAFLTSSSRSILPIRKIDDTQAGSEVPGPMTRRLVRAYHQVVCSQLETL